MERKRGKCPGKRGEKEGQSGSMVREGRGTPILMRRVRARRRLLRRARDRTSPIFRQARAPSGGPGVSRSHPSRHPAGETLLTHRRSTGSGARKTTRNHSAGRVPSMSGPPGVRALGRLHPVPVAPESRSVPVTARGAGRGPRGGTRAAGAPGRRGRGRARRGRHGRTGGGASTAEQSCGKVEVVVVGAR